MKKCFFVLFACFSFLFCACSKVADYTNSDNKVVVSVAKDDSFDILSTNPLTLNRGEDADFQIRFKDDYIFKKSTNGNYEKGHLIVSNVQYSQTIRIESARVLSVKVEEYENCHYSVKSENPMKVEKGQDAVFQIGFERGYVFESSINGNYVNDLFVVKNVETNIVTSIVAKQKGNIHLQVNYDTEFGKIKLNNENYNDEYFREGEFVKIEAIPERNAKFVCWSIGDTISKSMPLSFERILNYEVNNDVTLFANFWHDNSNTIIYSGNGGSTETGDVEIYYPHTIGNHIRTNTVQGSNAFFRSGYLLESWNTEPDGSGTRVGLGSRIKIPNNQNLRLYAVWIEETPTNFFSSVLNSEEESCSITSCTFEGEVLVIPKYIGNYKVTSIRKNALNSLSFKTLYFPEYLKEVESNSIVDCQNFDEFHFFDYLKTIPNDFYNGHRPSFVYINANTDPCYIGSYQGSFVRKTDLLCECDSEKIIFIGNSNTYYSIDGSMVASYFEKDVLCYGVQSGVGVAWELACLRHYCKNDKNIVVFCCEFDALNIGSFTEHKYFAAESNYDLLSLINFNELVYSNVFSAYSKFRELKSSATVTPYSKNDDNVDIYGCKRINIEPFHSDDWYASKIGINLNFYQNGGFKWVEDFCSFFTSSTFLISFCSFNKNCIKDDIIDEFYSSYQGSISSCTSYRVISRLTDYAFPGSAFNNDNYHLLYSFAVERTNKVISDIQSYVN